MIRFARAAVYATAGAAMIGLVGCSLVGNGYGGWYWQMPQVPASSSATIVGMNGTNSNSGTHAKSETTGQSSSQKG